MLQHVELCLLNSKGKKNLTSINDSFSLPVSPVNGLVVVQTTHWKCRHFPSTCELMYPAWKLRM